jgi:hypothetical protein
MVDNKTSYNNANYAPVKPQIAMDDFIISHDCLRFDRGIVRIVVTDLLSTMTI